MQQDAQQSVKSNRAKGKKANKVQEAKVEEVVEMQVLVPLYRIPPLPRMILTLIGLQTQGPVVI